MLLVTPPPLEKKKLLLVYLKNSAYLKRNVFAFSFSLCLLFHGEEASTIYLCGDLVDVICSAPQTQVYFVCKMWLGKWYSNILASPSFFTFHRMTSTIRCEIHPSSRCTHECFLCKCSPCPFHFCNFVQVPNTWWLAISRGQAFI